MTYRIKKLEEEFYNPYTEEEKLAAKDKKPVHISDKGGLLKPRREVFNINRVIYSKRPNGEFTILAKTQFARGEIIEICPIIFVGYEAKAIPRIKDFIFEIEKTGVNGGLWGLVLGYGSLYKHSEDPNVEYAYNRANRQMYFKALRTIQAQEELTINFGKDYWLERTSFGTMAPQNETPASTAPLEENNTSSDNITGLNVAAGSGNFKGNKLSTASPNNNAQFPITAGEAPGSIRGGYSVQSGG